MIKNTWIKRGKLIEDYERSLEEDKHVDYKIDKNGNVDCNLLQFGNQKTTLEDFFDSSGNIKADCLCFTDGPLAFGYRPTF